MPSFDFAYNDLTLSSIAPGTLLSLSSLTAPDNNASNQTLIYGIDIYPADNTLAIGGFLSGTVGFGGGSNATSAGNRDGFVSKRAANGSWLWHRIFGSTGIDEVRSVAINRTNGDILACGIFQGTINFGAGDTNASSVAGSTDCFVVCYSTNGTFKWKLVYGTSGSEVATGIATDSTGAAFVTGYYSGTLTIGSKTITAVGGTDAYLAKIATDGSVSWAKTIGSSGTEQGQAVAVDLNSGAVVVTGTATGAVNFGAGAVSYDSGQKVFLAKYSSTGTLIFGKLYGDTNFAFAGGGPAGNCVAVDASGNIGLCGGFLVSIDFGKGALTNPGGGYAMFLVRMNSSGVADGSSWQRVFGSFNPSNSFSPWARSITFSPSGNLFFCGSTLIALDFGNNWYSTSSGDYNVFIAKYLPSGDLDSNWAVRDSLNWGYRVTGGAYDDSAWGSVTDAAGNPVCAGIYYYQVDFGGTPVTSGGNSKGFIAKLSA